MSRNESDSANFKKNNLLLIC